MKDQLSSLAVTAVQILLPVVVAALGLLVKKLNDYTTVKVKNSKESAILVRLEDAAFHAVQEVQQTVVGTLDAKDPAGSAAKAKAAAMASVKSHLGPKGLDEVKAVLGYTDASAIDTVISSYIESKVLDLNKNGKAQS